MDHASHAERLKTDGYTIVEGVLDDAGLAEVRAGLAPLLGRWTGRNAFEGFATERVYTLAARGRIFEQTCIDERLLTLIGDYLAPRFLLTASQAICIHPGEAAQALHYDDSFYPLRRPRPPLSMSVVIAIDEFTETNGATVVIPGSQHWDDAEFAEVRDAYAAGQPHPRLKEAIPAVMPAGAAVVFQGTLIHGGGANRSAAPRLALTHQYCENWLRTQENLYLEVPREIVRTLTPKLQELLGYSIGPLFMGQVSASHPLKALEPDFTPPVGREYRHV